MARSLATGLLGAAVYGSAACESDVTTVGDGGVPAGGAATTTSGGGGGGEGGLGASGGGGASASGGSGGGASFSCGDDGLTCDHPQICVEYTHYTGPSQSVWWKCHDDPCAPAPLDCSCAEVLCSDWPYGPPCSMSGDIVHCQSGTICAAPDTPIATPTGERAIAELAVGDLVYSWHAGRLQVVPIARTSRTPVHDHAVTEVRLANGARLRISGGHPTADGRRFVDLAPGEQLGGQPIVSLATVPYDAAHTYDILPDSDTGTYLAAGALIGSTLHR